MNGNTRVGTELMSPVARAASRHACSMLRGGETKVEVTNL